MRILVIEDNIQSADYICKGLTENFLQADVAYDGQEGLYLALQNPYEVIILDVMLPKINGWALVQKIKASKPEIRIIFLTACDTVEQRVQGLELGADDYLIKPFAFSELLARVRTLLRRHEPQARPVIEIDDLKIDLLKHTATRNNTKLLLTSKEFALLVLLAKKKGEVLSRTYIAEQVWDINFECDTNVIDVAIKRLRNKIDDGFTQPLIHTVRGVGYVLEVR